MYAHTTRLCADCKNTPFGCSNDRKKVFTNCVHKDPQLTTKAIQKYKYKISFLQCDAEDYIASNLEEKNLITLSILQSKLF